MNAPAPELPALAWEALPGLFPSVPDAGRWLPLLQQHAALLEAASSRTRVTAVSPAVAVRRHYAESLEILRIAGAPGLTGPLADVGSGGGFPGLVAAIVLPGLEVHLVEPLRKRADLLAEAAVALGLSNVRVHNQRAEEAGRGPLRDACGTVTARAVAPLRELLEYTAPLAAPGGLLVLPKGSSVDEEVAASAHALEALGCGEPRVLRLRPEVSESVVVVLISRFGPTPAAYPRRPGMPAKRPL
jgi:16S rRNA (guanine527-N7)-methyltransferase